jgi:hypothetical protein
LRGPEDDKRKTGQRAKDARKERCEARKEAERRRGDDDEVDSAGEVMTTKSTAPEQQEKQG